LLLRFRAKRRRECPRGAEEQQHFVQNR
jgi:hypothetical protein